MAGSGRALWAGVSAILGWTALIFAFTVGAAKPQSSIPVTIVYGHLGVGTCAGSACHGRLAPNGPTVRQNELFSWQDESGPVGAHSRAWKVLTQPRAQGIADRMGLGKASDAKDCLGCHADPDILAEPRLAGPKLQISDGVGCETCHGGSSGWAAGHYVVGASHANNVSNGMTALERPQVAAQVCLDCHLGSQAKGQFVSHRMMAAGHPRLSFELDLFLKLQGHHDADADYRRRKSVAGGAKTWAVGQAEAARRSLSLFADPQLSRDGAFPQFYFFDCHSCHRAISDDPKAKATAVANPGRPLPPGFAPFNDENLIMLSAAARIAAPQEAARFDAAVIAFHTALAQDREKALGAARDLSIQAGRLSTLFQNTTFARAQTLAILKDVLSGALDRYTDYAGAAQAVMATDTLLAAIVTDRPADTAAVRAMRADIDRAYKAVDDPNTFRPADFRTAMQRVAAAVGRL